LATTSLGFANTLGTADVSLAAIIENCRTIATATDLPVSADLENCGADEPNAAAQAIGLAAEAGAVGGSIEDSTGDPQAPIYDFALAVERVQAAVEAARALPFPFTLTRGPRTCCMARAISTTPSAACRPSRPWALTCCILPASATSTPSGWWSPRLTSRSIW
jgi:2-methylisocitrate lyase-like PEP mutase family enzyme